MTKMRNEQTIWIVAAILGLGLGADPLRANDVFELQKIAPREEVQDDFGATIAVAGDVAVVRSALDKVLKIYIQDHPGRWRESATLKVHRFSFYGSSAAITGPDARGEYTIAASGARFVNGDVNKYYRGILAVFKGRGSHWVQTDLFDGPWSGNQPRYPRLSVVVDDKHLAMAGDDVIQVYRHIRGGWVPETELAVPGGYCFSDCSLALSGDTLVIGNPHVDGNVEGSGLVGIYKKTVGAWSPSAVLTASDGRSLDQFGYSVAVSGNRLVVGAPFGDGGWKRDSGTMYVFEHTGRAWVQNAKLTPRTVASGDWFGYSVALEGDTAVAGARRATGSIAYGGAAYVFAREASGSRGSTWAERSRLLPSIGQRGERFGQSVAMSGSTILAGAPGSTGALNDGVVRAYRCSTSYSGCWASQ